MANRLLNSGDECQFVAGVVRFVRKFLVESLISMSNVVRVVLK